jgi:hypothetical protein
MFRCRTAIRWFTHLLLVAFTVMSISGSATIHDLWSHPNPSNFSDHFSATLNAHVSHLLQVTP